ncbi:MAG: hypothetical protein ACPG49_14550, partial [Chitinophagales bacterium]
MFRLEYFAKLKVKNYFFSFLSIFVNDLQILIEKSMIINFSIKNFTSIKEEVTLSFEATNSDDLEEYYIVTPKRGLRLLKLGLVYGSNGSGKSNILE